MRWSTVFRSRREDPYDSPAYQLEKMREREWILMALVRAVEAWPETVRITAEAPDVDAAIAALRSAYGLDKVQATAVLDTQFRRVTVENRARLSAELTEFRARIEELSESLAVDR